MNYTIDQLEMEDVDMGVVFKLGERELYVQGEQTYGEWYIEGGPSGEYYCDGGETVFIDDVEYEIGRVLTSDEDAWNNLAFKLLIN